MAEIGRGGWLPAAAVAAAGTYRAFKRGAAGSAAYGAGRFAKRMMMSEEKRIVKKALKVAHELKILDVSMTYTEGTSITLTLLNPVVQGTTGENRTGRKIKMANIQFRGTRYIGASAGQDSDVVRTLVILDREARGGAPTQAQIFQNSGGGLDTLNSPINRDNAHRFGVLYDRVQVMNVNGNKVAGAAGAQSPYAMYTQLNFTVNLRDRTAYYFDGGNTGTITDIDEASVYLVTISEGAIAGLIGESRLNFRDV